MKKAIYKKIGERVVEKHVNHLAELDDEGNVIKEGYSEVIEVTVPIMGTVYEEMTQEEIDTLQQEEVQEPTLEERLEAMENAMLEIILGGTL